MLILISPAKTLDFDTAPITEQYSTPQFLDQSQQLIKELRKLTPDAVSQLMKISDKLAALNVARYASWKQPFTPKNAKQAVLAFKGDVYTGLDAETLPEEGLEFAQRHLRILSGLYGLLKPLDLMQPYRLEMGTKFANSRGKNLYEYWGSLITEQLNQELENQEMSEVINLASNEYYKSVKPKQLNARIVTPIFKDWKNGQYKIISFYAKKARGLMARYIIDEHIDNANALKSFDYAGYEYNPDMSKGDDWVFTRKEAP
ncbi:peroxide stress protein YaaA [Aestuariirhabdus sp. Z084]|uniref:peroxide stress protein YaaA n=1 Tax=Aestuariirhabdus haliotis TaxID=2918751 RepID=UPI00201B373B|nr:peroxide stress protein YaaA [Aestuariirhabdus haliotis]MCL6415256.1 peroxide stress protein YaaA [Aestuariirhabdus haliotis]MCL6419516.1 peroxide stress protein YaaA [Aestuariirhabdus haliotis]